MTRAARVFSLFAVACGLLPGQTTQGLITGRLLDSRSGRSIAKAEITYWDNATNAKRSLPVTDGSYVFPLLSPGLYHMRVESDDYQAQEIFELNLPVAAHLRLDFYLRPKGDVFAQASYLSVYLPGHRSVVTFYGPDIDTSRLGSFDPPKPAVNALESTLSDVIDPARVRELPLAGRDVYTMLVTQPGVSSDSATGRGLGLAANGQRPTASNFLLDGVENNNYLITGPLTAIAPEAVQEYRVSTNNFSAEYGRTSGYLANAITRSGGGEWHGLAYYYAKNDALNANEFQRNLRGLPRTRLRESQPGFFIGGPLRGNTLFASASFEYLRLGSRGDAETFSFPAAGFIQALPSGGLARELLDRFKPPDNPTAARPDSLNRYLALPRIDRLWGKHRLMGRLALARLERPEFLWSPYKDFTAPLTQNATGLALTWIDTIGTHFTHEARFGWSADELRFDRPKPGIPALVSFDGFALPGSAASSYLNRGVNWEVVSNLTWVRGNHVLKAGGGLLARSLDGYLTAFGVPEFVFNTIGDFAQDHPQGAVFALARAEYGLPAIPQYGREYRYRQFSGFAQDSFRVSPGLVLNIGARYENFGVPHNTGAVKDGVVQFGDGATIVDRLKSARLVYPGAGDQQLYARDNQDWAVRAGFALNPGGGKTLLRGSFGVFYDRPFDNLWQNLRNNNIARRSVSIAAARTDYLQPLSQILTSLGNPDTNTTFPKLTMYQPGIRTPYVHSYFLGVQRQVTEDLAVEANAVGSFGRKLITTDVLNREFSNRPGTAQNRFARYNAALPDIYYRANQGGSSYNGLTAIVRYRTRRAQFQAAYTWSHTIDNQSRPLAGDYFDLGFTGRSGRTESGVAAFSRQFDSRADRGSSDFDQRHNFVGFAIWELPWRLRGWKLAGLWAVRSGSPFSVNAFGGLAILTGEPILNNRADIIAENTQIRVDATGGKRLLNKDAFRAPPAGRLGNSGRNAFGGPGLYNVDLSLSRSFALRWLGERGRVVVRADAFNFLNHANLDNPFSLFGPQDFGVAQFGRKGFDTGFPGVTPLNEKARQVQLLLRLEF